MPYDLTFMKPGVETDGVTERLLPALQQRYGEDVRSDDAYIKFDADDVALAVEIFAGDREGAFRVTLTSSTRHLAFLKKIEDVPQLEELKRIVAGEIAEWTGRLPDVAPMSG
jgi:hypothetical protein